MSALDILRWCFTGLLGLFSLYVIGMNYACAYVGLFRKEHHSLAPLVGGVAGVLALLICPVASVHAWAWLPFVWDLGCAFSIFSFLYAVIVLKAFK